MPTHRQHEFAELLANHQSQIYGFVRAMVRRTEDAQDLHQQTLMVLWKKFDQFVPGTNFLGWALRVAEFEVRNFRRRHQALTGLSEDVLSKLAGVLQTEAESNVLNDRKAALESCLAKLPLEDRSLIQQAYGQQQRVKSIAQQLGRLPQSISNSLRRIRRALFDCVERAIASEGRGV